MGVTGITLQWQWLFLHGLFHNTTGWTRLPLILTVGEFGPADCFLQPLQFWHRLSASEMKEQRESSSKRSESSKENLSPSSHSANISSITLDGGEGGKKKSWSLGVSCSSAGRSAQLSSHSWHTKCRLSAWAKKCSSTGATCSLGEGGWSESKHSKEQLA